MSTDEDDEHQPLVVNHQSSASSNGNVAKCRQRVASGCVLLTLTLERVAFYSLVGNLYLFLNSAPFNWFSYRALNASYMFTGIIYFVSPLWGFLADSVLGKFKALAVGLLLYIAGYSILVVVSDNHREVQTLCEWQWSNHSLWPVSNHSGNSTQPIRYGQPCDWQLHLVLVVIGLAVGCIKANLAPFGADQVKKGGRDVTRTFMTWYYWCINIGAFLALGGIVYIQQSLKNGFFLGYLIPTCCLAVALMVYLIGRPTYLVEKPVKSILADVCRITCEACTLHRHKRSRSPNRIPVDISPDTSLPPSWIDMAKVRYGGSFHESAVEDVKSLGKIIIVFIALIPYWMVYFQMHTTFIAQGLHMRFDPEATENSTQPQCEADEECEVKHGFMIPVAWLSLFDVIFLILAIPLLDRVVYPALERSGCALTYFSRIGFGMGFAFVAVVMAGFLEMYRLELVSRNETTIHQFIGDTPYPAADLWIFWQIPQYSLIGISEVFASVAGLELAYTQAPRSMKGLIMGMFCSSMGIGSFFGTGLLSIVRPFWFSDEDFGNINYSHLDYYLFLLGAIQLITLGIYSLGNKKLQFGRTERRDTNSLGDSARFSFVSSERNFVSGESATYYPAFGEQT